MRRLMVVLSIALVITLLSLTVVAGAGARKTPRTATSSSVVPFALTGDVVAVDAANGTMTVTVAVGNKALRGCRGTDVTLTITPDTTLQTWVDGVLTPISLDAFAAGDRISAVGQKDASDPAAPVFTSARVTLRPLQGSCGGCSG